MALLWCARVPQSCGCCGCRQRSRGALEFSCSGVVCAAIVAQGSRGALQLSCSGLVCTGILAQRCGRALEFPPALLSCTAIVVQRCGVHCSCRAVVRCALQFKPALPCSAVVCAAQPPSRTPGYPAPPARFREYLPPRASCAGTDWTTLISAPRRSF